MTTNTEALPPLPETGYVLAREARPYESEYILSEPGYSEDDMRAYASAALAQQPQPSAEPVQQHELSAWKLAMAQKAAQPAPAPAAQPDGTLHADGYFTWAEGKRPAYLLDKGLPAKFWLAAPAAQPAPAPAAQPWQPIETMPKDGGSYLVADAVRGMVAPHTRGVIHNNPGTAHDWQYGEAITHWMPLPTPPQADQA